MLTVRKSHMMYEKAHPHAQGLLGFHGCAKDRPQGLKLRVRPWQGWRLGPMEAGLQDNDKPGNFRELRSHSAASGTFRQHPNQPANLRFSLPLSTSARKNGTHKEERKGD